MDHMKLVLFSDVHLDAPFSWLRGNEASRRRRQALRDALQRIVRLAAEVRADALLCGGDLYEQARFSQDTRAFVESLFASIHPMPVLLAPGNHDWYAPTSLYAQARWSPNVHVFTESRLSPVTLCEGLTIWGAAHRAPAFTENFLDRFRVDRSGVNIGLFHGSERGWFGESEGGPAPHAPFDPGQIESAGLNHVLLGHFHRFKDAARHTYPGNPEFLAFGEEAGRGAVIVTVQPDGTVTRERRKVSATSAHDLPLDVSGCTNLQDVRSTLESLLVGREGVARVTIHGDIDPDMALHASDLDGVQHHLDGLLVEVGRISPRYDFAALNLEPTVRGQFVRNVYAAQMEVDDRWRVLVTGLRALEGRDDLDVT